jgi:hypothetical protein
MEVEMKYLGIFIIILALVIAVLPQFTDCHSQGRTLTLENGKTVDMKCHWTAIAELILGILLAAVGGMLVFTTQKQARITLSFLGGLMGIFVVLVPVTLIGVCASDMMLCNSVMKPSLILSGILVVVASMTGMIISYRAKTPAA